MDREDIVGNESKLLLAEAFIGGMVDAANGANYGGNFDTAAEQTMYDHGQRIGRQSDVQAYILSNKALEDTISDMFPL
jgi:hypothetical protein